MSDQLFLTQQTQQNERKSIISRGSINPPQMQSINNIAPQEIIEEKQDSPEKIIQDLQKAIQRKLKFINIQSPRTKQSMMIRKITPQDIIVQTPQTISKILEYQIQKQNYNNVIQGIYEDQDINFEKLVFANYVEHLQQVKRDIEQIQEERRSIINAHSEKLFLQTHGQNNSFLEEYQKKSAMGTKSQLFGSRSFYGSMTFDQRKQSIQSRQEERKRVQRNLMDKEITREIELMKKKKENEIIFQEWQARKKKAENQKLIGIKRNMKKLNQKIKDIKEFQKEGEMNQLTKAQEFMKNLDKKCQENQEKLKIMREQQKSLFLNDERKEVINYNIHQAQLEGEQQRLAYQSKIEEDLLRATQKKEMFINRNIQRYQSQNLSKVNKMEYCMQTLQEQQNQKLQNYLRAEESCQKMKESLLKKSEKFKKSRNKENKQKQEKIQENLERIKEKQEKQSEEILNEFQNRFEKVSYNKHKLQDEQFNKTDKFKKFKDIQEANKRRLQLEQDIKADDLLHTAFEKKSNMQHQKQEQEKLKYISQQFTIQNQQENQILDQKLNIFQKTLQLGKEKPIIKNLKELGSLTYSDSFKYKQFFPEEKKKKPEDGDED